MTVFTHHRAGWSSPIGIKGMDRVGPGFRRNTVVLGSET